MDFKDISETKGIELESLQKQLSSAFIERDEPMGFQGEGVMFGETPPKMHTEDYLRAAVGWVYGCVSAIADAVSKVQLRLYTTDADGEIQEVLSHKSLDLLYKVNKFTTFYDHLSLSQQYLELTGEAPWFMDRGKNGLGEPQGIMLLRPDKLTLKQTEDKTADNPIEKYIYRQDFGDQFDIKPSEMILLKYPDPINSFRGKGTLQAAAVTVDIDTYAEDYNKRFFFNSARPDSILSTEQGLSKAQKDDLRASLNKLYKGADKAHKTAILEKGLKWSSMSVSAKDMDFLEQQKYTMAKILSIFRVPKPIVAVSDDVNLANARIAEYVFAKWTIKPKLERIIAQLNEFYLPMFKGTENMFLSFDDPVPADIELNIKRYDSALTHGYMTANEIRSELNLDDAGPDGDKLYIPNSFQEIGTPPASSLFSLAVPVKPKKNFKGFIDRSAGGFTKALLAAKAQKEVKEKVEKIESRIDELALNIVTAQAKVKHQEEVNRKEALHAQRKDFVDAYLKSADAYEKHFATGAKLVFENQKKKLLAKVPQKAIKATDWELDEGEETDIMVRVFTPLEKEIIKQQGNRAALLAGQGRGGFDLATKTVQEFLKTRVFKFSFEVNEETNRLLAETLKVGVAEGEGVPQLRKRVEGLFNDMEQFRAERIARSEVIRASNFATTEAYHQSGVVDSVEWLSTEDGNACEWCDSINGKTISLGETFFAKGDTFEGKDGGKLDLNYESINFPPLHPNCRCTVVPIIK